MIYFWATQPTDSFGCHGILKLSDFLQQLPSTVVLVASRLTVVGAEAILTYLKIYQHIGQHQGSAMYFWGRNSHLGIHFGGRGWLNETASHQ